MGIRTLGALTACITLLSACSPFPVPMLALPARAAAAGALPPAPPWPAPTDPMPGIQAAGITPGATEQLRYHTHTHLDVYYEGARVEVPGGIGLDPQGRFLSSLHTHSTSGVVHMETGEPQAYTLGQFFAEWGVPLAGATVYDRGVPIGGDAAGFVLPDNHEVVVAFGRPPESIPIDYDRWVCLWMYLCN